MTSIRMNSTMKVTDEHNQRIAKITFTSLYPHYEAKVLKKGRSREELQQVIQWLTGFDDEKLHKFISRKTTFEDFFIQAI